MKWQNKVQLVGYLGKDPLVRILPSGYFYAVLRVATNNGFTKQGKERVTAWHTVKYWGKKASYIQNCFMKGSHVLVDGTLQYHTFTNKEGHTCQSTEIKASLLLNLDR